jgi:hypothetical protein
MSDQFLFLAQIVATILVFVILHRVIFSMFKTISNKKSESFESDSDKTSFIEIIMMLGFYFADTVKGLFKRPNPYLQMRITAGIFFAFMLFVVSLLIYTKAEVSYILIGYYMGGVTMCLATAFIPTQYAGVPRVGEVIIYIIASIIGGILSPLALKFIFEYTQFDTDEFLRMDDSSSTN